MKKIIFLFTLSFGLMFFTSCKNSSKSDVPKEERVEYASTYVCPMHCEGSGSEEPGECPTCGMDYVMNEDKAGASDEDHNGHDHGAMEEDSDSEDNEGHNH